MALLWDGIIVTLTMRLERDPYPESPEEFGNLGEIAYNARSRYVLGTESVGSERMKEIAHKIDSGEYIGMPVFAYVHSGGTIKAAYNNPFDCPWDSGQSGFVYIPVADALKDYERRKMSKKLRERVLNILCDEVETYNMYLTGDVWGVIIEDERGKTVASLWGLYGEEYAEQQGSRLLKEHTNERESTASTVQPARSDSPKSNLSFS